MNARSTNTAHCLLPALLIIPSVAFAQPIFQRITGSGGNDKAWSVLTESDGSWLITGWTTGNWGTEDIILCKSDSSGTLLWTHLYGGSLVDFGMDVNRTRDGGYIITGYGKSYGAGDDDIYLIRTDSTGRLLWAKTYGGPAKEVGYSVQETSDRGFIVCGSTQSFGVGANDMYLIKTDSAGNRQWSRTMGHTMSDFAYSVRETADSSFIVTGSYWPAGGSSGVYLAKFSAGGNLIWSKVYSSPASDVGHEVWPMKDGGFLVSGWTAGTGSYDGYLLKTNAGGNKAWELAIGSADFEQFESAVETSGGGIIAAGNTQGFGFANRRFYTAGVDSAGNVLWTRAYADRGANFGRRVRESTNNTLIVTGETSYPSSINIFTVKMLAGGDAVCDTVLNSTVMQPNTTVSDTVMHFLIPADTVITAAMPEAAWWFSDTTLCDSVVSPPVALYGPDNKNAAPHIFPNPAAASVTVTGGAGIFSLTDLSGRKVFQHTLGAEASTRMDLSGLRPGIYVYRIVSGRGPEKYGKLVVMGAR